MNSNNIELIHPCFDYGSRNARIHLPVAGQCNLKCNYCVRKYDCLNESRPGVTSKLMKPQEAFEYFKRMNFSVKNISIAGIAGPGDSLADFKNTKETFQLIRNYNRNIKLCMATNGLLLKKYASELIYLGLNYLTVTINSVNPQISAQIYEYMVYGNQYIDGSFAGEILLNNQLDGLRLMIKRGVICKVNIVAIKGINDFHIQDVVKTVKKLGVHMTNIMPLIPVKGSRFETVPLIDAIELDDIRKQSAKEIKQMYHCKQCRADACGKIT